MGGGGGSASGKLKKAAEKFLVETRGKFCRRKKTHVIIDACTATTVTCDTPNSPSPPENLEGEISPSEITGQTNSSTSPPDKNSCAICLDPLNYSSSRSSGQSIFTAECSHAFHLTCISSNVRHGRETCPICRAHWTKLPLNFGTHCPLEIKKTHIDSIANSWVHRQTLLHSARYDDDDDDDDQIGRGPTSDGTRLRFSLLTVPITQPTFESSSLSMAESPVPSKSAHLRVKSAHWPATDLVLISSPKGPHLRIMKQFMTLIVFSLRPMDRLAIVSYSSSGSRIFPLRPMALYAKRLALQVIDHMFYMGQADPIEGLEKGVKILEDRVEKNLYSCIMHLTDCPSMSYHGFDTNSPVQIHRFHAGFGFGTSNEFIMSEFKDFFGRTLGGVIHDIELRFGEGTGIVRIGELKGGEARNIPFFLGDSGHLRVEYSYIDSGDGDCIKNGEIVLGVEDKDDGDVAVSIGMRTTSVESWDSQAV